MGKDSKKDLIGQPLFKQIVDIIPKSLFEQLVLDKKADRYYKRFDSWTQLVTLLYGAFSRCDSSTEVVEGMQSLQGKLNYFGMNESPAKSTFGDGLRNRSEELFRLFYFQLIDHFKPFLSVSQTKKDVPFEKLYAFDSTTISLFSDIMKGVGRNPKGDGKKKGGVKVHMLTDIHSDTANYALISEAKQHDKKFLNKLNLPKGSMAVFDKAYNHYQQFDEWTEEGIFFVCRLKDNALYKVKETLFEQTLQEGEKGVMKSERITLCYKKEKQEKEFELRKVTYRDETGRVFQFITNNFDITDEQVAYIYKLRWSIELMFKKIKQNFQLKYFFSDTVNGIKTQIWCTLIAHLLLSVIKANSKTKKAFSTVATIIRLNLIAMIGLLAIVTNSTRVYFQRTRVKNKGSGLQLSLF